LITVNQERELKVGALGAVPFETGSYAYIGSAQNGIRQRVSRHLSNEKKLYWHIDYLLANEATQVKRVFAKRTKDKKEECRLANKVASIGRSVKNFGCSDCNCPSHLYQIKDETELKQLLVEANYRPYPK